MLVAVVVGMRVLVVDGVGVVESHGVEAGVEGGGGLEHVLRCHRSSSLSQEALRDDEDKGEEKSAKSRVCDVCVGDRGFRE